MRSDYKKCPTIWIVLEVLLEHPTCTVQIQIINHVLVQVHPLYMQGQVFSTGIADTQNRSYIFSA